jgi:hypothetical protein
LVLLWERLLTAKGVLFIRGCQPLPRGWCFCGSGC